MTDTASYAESIRKRNHVANPAYHPHDDPNGLSTRIRNVTGYAPTPEALIELIVNEARTFDAAQLATLTQRLEAVAPNSAPPRRS